jgi:putative transposase
MVVKRDRKREREREPPSWDLKPEPNDKLIVPFWTKHTRRHARRAWLPTGRAVPVPVDNGSWFSHRELVEAGVTAPWTERGARAPAEKKQRRKRYSSEMVDVELVRARKILLRPTADQRAILRGWFGGARFAYNAALELCEAVPEMRSRPKLRSYVVTSDLLPPEWAFLRTTPNSIRDGAVDDLLTAYKSNFEKLKSKGKSQTKFKIQFRSRKAVSQSISIQKGDFSSKYPGVFYVTLLGKDPIASAEPLPPITADCRLQMTRDGRFFLCVPHTPPVRENQASSGGERVVAIDPGVRTFATGYDPTGSVFEFGAGDMGRIHRLCAHADKLVSRIAKAERKRRPHMRKALWRMNERVRNLVAELHWKLARYLCDRYTTILLPEFETQKMANRSSRRIGSKTVRSMLTMSHYSFRMRLLSKAEEYGGEVKVVLCNEAYTSKTCGACGELNDKLGSKKRFRCPRPECRLRLDRDVNGARNILLRALRD